MSDLLTTIALLFIIAGPFLLVGSRFDLPTIPLLLLAGIAAGPIIDETVALQLAQVGIALLVFGFGINIEFAELRTVLSDSEIAAFGQIVTVGSLGVGLGLLSGLPLGEAGYLGIAAAFSSTIIGGTSLQSDRNDNLVHGRLAASIQFVQDMVAIGILLVIGATAFEPDPIATRIGYGLALLIGAVIVNRYLFDTISRFAGDSEELLIVGVVSLLIVFVAIAELVGISIVIGAFAAGIAVRHDPVEYLELFNGLASIRDFFATVFFITIGALVSLPVIELGIAASIEMLVLVGGLFVLTALLKPAVTIAVLTYTGYGARSATLTGFMIDQTSEFALIIAIEALALGLLSQTVFDAIILAAALTMITSSFTQQYGEELYQMLSEAGILQGQHRHIDERSAVPNDLADHTIILGYGSKGRQLVAVCEELGEPYVVIENDPARLDRLTACDGYVFGDAMEAYPWQKANAQAARLIISTVNTPAVSERLLAAEYKADLILRTDEVSKATAFLDRGAAYVCVPSVLAGRQLTTHLRRLFDAEMTPNTLRETRLAELEAYIEARDN